MNNTLTGKTMKVTDLMVGDLVEQIQDFVSFAPIKIEEVRKDYVVFSNGVCRLKYDEIAPIPLTEEILVKNGFKKVNEHYECIVDKQLAGDGFEVQQIIIHSNNAVTIYTCIAKILIHIDYVHQLQHLIRLAGVQKEIEL